MPKPLVLATTIATLLIAEPSRAAEIFWDGTGTSWNTLSSWSMAVGATTPDPTAVPGLGDIATFHTSTITGTAARLVNLDGDQSVLGLATASGNKFLTTLQGGGTNRTLSIGTEGINHLFGGLDIGSTTEGQQVAVSLLGSQTWTSSSSGSVGAVAIRVYNNVSFANSGSQTLTLTGVTTGGGIYGIISDGAGVLNLTKTNGTGRWTLTGENTYTGVTTLSGGTLAVTTIGNGGVASNLGAATSAASNLVFDGGTLLYTGDTASTDRSFTVTNGRSAIFDIEKNNTTLTLSGTSAATNSGLTKDGLGALELSVVHTYSGATRIAQGRLALSGAGSIANSTITIGQDGNGTTMNTVADSGALTVSGAGGTVVRTGDLTVNGGVLSNTRNVGTLLVNGSSEGDSHDIFGGIIVNNGAFWGKVAPYLAYHTQVTFSSLTRSAGTQVHFDSPFEGLGTSPIADAMSASANVLFTEAPTLHAAGGTFDTPNAPFLPYATVNGVIATYDSIYGLRALNTNSEMADLASATAGQNAKVSSAGTTTLNADKTVNSLWGDQGTVALGSSTLTVASGAIAARGNYTIGASASDGTVALGDAEGNLMAGSGAALTINSAITGSKGLTIGLTDSATFAGAPASAVVLGGANTFTGPVKILANNSNLRLTLTNALALQGATLEYRNYGGALRFGINDPDRGLIANLTSATIGALNGNQNLALTNSGPAGGGVALTVGVNNATTTYSGVLSGAGSLIKDGTGTLAITGGAANTYSGATIIKQGILDVNKSSGTTTFVAIPGDLTIESGGKLRFNNTNTHHQIANDANVVMSGAGSVFNGTGINAGVANITDTFASLTVTGGTVHAGQHSIGFIVTGMASFTGGEGETIFIGNSSAQFTVGGLTLKGMTATAAATITTPNHFTLYGNNGSTRSKLTIGSLGLTLDGSVMNLRLGATGAKGSHVVLNGDVTTTGTSPSRIIRDTDGGSAGQISVDLGGTTGTVNRTFTIGDGGADLTIAIPVVNGTATSGAITKEGAGTMTLTAANTYTGGTTINAGTLLANNPTNPAGSATGTGPVSVSLNGTLGGTGIISGAVTVASGGTLLGGNGLTATEDLTLSGSVSLASDSVIKLTLGVDGTHSSLTRTGSGLWSFAPTQAFSFIDLGAEPGFYDNIIAGLASAPAGIEQWTIFNEGFVGTFSYAGGNIDLTLTAVPEPSTVATLLGGIGLLGGFRRFARRR